MICSAIPKATLGRLPQYLQYLRSLQQGDGGTISATMVAKGLDLGEVQVRKDLAAVSGAGKPKIGYVTADLIAELEKCLGKDSLTSAVLVGAGKLGQALLNYNGFEEFGVKIIAAFDCNKQTVESDDKIFDIADLEDFCYKNEVKLGIITVGKASAQQICDRLISCGISGIWNFAPCGLKVPERIVLKQENLALSLAYLNSQISK